MTADEISKIAAGLMNMSFPDDKEKLYFLCTMTNREAWMKGKWHGMIKEFHVNIKTDYEGRQYITAPDDHNVLLGVNLDSKPVPIKNHWFQFHRNSNGSVSKEQGWNMTGSAMDMGHSPVIEQPRRRNEISATEYDPVYLAVRSRGYCDDGKIVTISGENKLGEKNISYKKIGAEKIRTLDSPNIERLEVMPTYGVEHKLTNKFSFYENIFWSQITEIRKEVTVAPVDVYAFHETGEAYIVATLMPHQTRARYRNYLLPQECATWKCCHILCKASEPEVISYGSQPMVTDDLTALIDIMIGNDYKYHKRDLPTAAAYILSGVSALEQSSKENTSNHQSPMQVDEGIYAYPEHHLK